MRKFIVTWCVAGLYVCVVYGQCYTKSPTADTCQVCAGGGGGFKFDKCDSTGNPNMCMPVMFGKTTCATIPTNCGGRRIEYQSLWECQMNMGGDDVGPCLAQYPFAATSTSVCPPLQ